MKRDGLFRRKITKPNFLNPIQYFEEALSLFQGLPAYHTDQLSLADRTVALCTPSMDLREKLLPALSHLLIKKEAATQNTSKGQAEKEPKPALTIWYAEDKDLPKRLQAPPWTGFNGQGYNAALDQEDIQIFFQPWQTQIFLYSRTRRTGIYWVQRTEELPWWECTFSFRTLFHCWTIDLPAQLVHAGAMAKNGTGVLITGQSGSGKSTSCLNLLRAGYEYLGDDYVWIELGTPTKVFSLYQTAKVEPDNFLQRFSDWEPFLKNRAEYQQQKAIFDIKDLYPAAAIDRATIKAILLPKVAHQENTCIEYANPTQALMAMAPTTLHHLPHGRTASYKKLLHIAGALPGYHWKLGYDTNYFITTFEAFMQNER